jgi:hypothetical protein
MNPEVTEAAVILPFPRLPRHRPYAAVIRQNHAQAEEHLETAHTRCDVLTEAGLRMRREALARWQAAHEARQQLTLASIREAL